MPLIKILTRTICDKKDVAAGAVVDASPSAANILVSLGKAEPFVGEPEPEAEAEAAPAEKAERKTTAKATKPKRNPTTKKKPKEG